MSFTIHYDYQGARERYRAELPGVMLFLPSGEPAQVKDISSTGLSFQLPTARARIAPNTTVKTDLFIAGKRYMKGLMCKIVRISDKGIAAATFEELDLVHEAKLDKLILEIQKRAILHRNAQQQHY